MLENPTRWNEIKHRLPVWEDAFLKSPCKKMYTNLENNFTVNNGKRFTEGVGSYESKR